VSNTYESHIQNYHPIIVWEYIGKFLKLDGNTMGNFWELGGNIKTLLQNMSPFHYKFHTTFIQH
jgi:hypothetical protein